MRRSNIHCERVVTAAIALLLLASLSWTGWARRDVKRIRANPVAVHLAKSAYRQMEWPATVIKHEPWTAPSLQSAGNGWVYELFTPPVVFYNPSTHQFAVTSPAGPAKVPSVFAIELISVRRELYQLQLSGYFGEPGAYTAVFTQPSKPGTLFAREGTRLEEQALTLKKFSLRRISSLDNSGSGVSEPVAFAELDDERAGATVMLNGREPKFADAPIAVVRVNLSGTALREVRAGDIISEGKSVYRIDRVSYTPAELVVSREETGHSSVETKVLHPVEIDSATVVLQSVEPFPLFPRPATGFVTPEK